MHTVLEVGDGFVRAQAGVTLDALDAALAPRGLVYAPVPTWTAATVGGIVSTNAAGPATFKYGVTRDWVLALTVVLPCGDVLDVRRGDACVGDGGALRVVDEFQPDRPDRSRPRAARRAQAVGRLSLRAGHGCHRPLRGCGGHAGVVVDATLRTMRRRAHSARAFVPVPSEPDAIEFVRALRHASHRTWQTRDAHGIDVSAIEHLDRQSRWSCCGRMAWTTASRSHGPRAHRWCC